MSHIMFPTSAKTLSSFTPPSLPIPRLGPSQPGSQPTSVKLRRRNLNVTCSASVVDCGESSVAGLERCYTAPSALASSSSVEFGPVMKGGQYGAFGAVTLEKGKLDLTQKQSQSSPELAVGGGGGDIGKKINHGGGDGGDDGGDDDDYFDDFDDGDEGDDNGLFRRRMLLEELFDRKFLEAVLNEWQKTMMDLPAGFRQAYEMQSMLDQPVPDLFREHFLKEFLGHSLAGCYYWLHCLVGVPESIKQEWDLALINVLTVSACNAFVVWSLAPCRSYGSTFQFDLQNTLQKLPNNIFENSYPLREFDVQKRIHSLFLKAAELCLVGLTAGAVQGSLSNVLAGEKKERLSVTIPTMSTNALGYGAFLGLYANLRYQLLCGFDRAVINHFDVIGVTLFLSTALRILSVQLGKRSRHAWLDEGCLQQTI